MKTVLYLEEKPHVRENLIKMMDCTGFFRVLSAATASEAIDLLERIKIDIVIIGRQITAGEVDVLVHYLRPHAAVKLIAMADRKSPVAGILKAFELGIQFETPTDINMLLETLLRECDIHSGGQLRGVSIAAFLQMIELEDKTCSINVMTAGKLGRLYCRSGELIEAEIDGLTGKAAALKILDMENALIVFDYDPLDKERTIDASLMSLLLENGRNKDEKEPERKERRRYKRFDCKLPVTFYYGEESYAGQLTSISLSGVFLQTEGLFAVGEEIWIVLYSPSLDKGCRMKGIVARKASHGFGIEFPPACINHMAILRTIIHEVQAVERD